MTQILRPVSDASIGSWTTESGATTNLYASVDEAVASDSDYAVSSGNPTSDTLRLKLSSGSDPLTSSGYEVHYRIGESGWSPIAVEVRLVQGASTLIASWDHPLVPTTATDFVQTLTGPQADAITDHTDLYLEFVASQRAPVINSFEFVTSIDAIKNEDILNERVIQTIDIADGKLWPTYGEWTLLGGPRKLVSVNPATGVSTIERDPIGTDYFRVWGVSNGDIFVTWTDPSTGSYPSYSKRISGVWSDGGSDVFVTHIFGFAEFAGNYYMCGSRPGPTFGNDQAYVYKSTNGGASWTEDLIRIETTIGSESRRFYGFYQYDDRLYVQESKNGIFLDNGWYTTGGAWTQDTVPIPFSSGSFGFSPMRWFNKYIFVGTSYGSVSESSTLGMLLSSTSIYRLPLDRSTPQVLAFGAVQDITIHTPTNSTLIVGADYTMKQSFDSSTQRTIVSRDIMPAGAKSITYFNGDIFVGDRGGRIWKASTAPISGTTLLVDNFETGIASRGFTYVDTNAQFFFSSVPTARFNNKNAGSWGDPRIVYNTPFTRSNTLRAEFYISRMASNSTLLFGFMGDTAPAGYASGRAAIGKNGGTLARSIPSSGILALYDAGGVETYGGREYRIAVRDTGSVMYMRGNGLAAPYDDNGTTRAKWLPVAMEHLDTTTNLYAGICVQGLIGGFFIPEKMRIYTADAPNTGDVEDTFTRANSTTTLGTAEIGPSWSAVVGTWGINTNQGYSPTVSATPSLAVVSTSARDGIVKANVSGISATSAAGVIFRSDGTNQNYWRAYYDGTNFKVDKVVAGTATNVFTTADAATSGLIQVTLYGARISVHKGAGANTIATTSINDAALQTNTQHGLYTVQTASATARFDNFGVFGPLS